MFIFQKQLGASEVLSVSGMLLKELARIRQVLAYPVNDDIKK